jgi:hypothetical protein
MQSARAWAGAQGFDYRFIDDRLFGYVPEWYRRGAGSNVQVIANLARLLVARELLSAGYERTIWIDADILVFDLELFRIEVVSDFAFCHQVWVETQMSELVVRTHVNNSVSVFVRGNSFLEFCIWAHEDLVRSGKRIYAHGTTTRLLTALYKAVPFPLLTNVGVLSPIVAHDIRNGVNTLARKYAALHGAPIRAINLGGSLCGKRVEGNVLDNHDYDVIVDAIESTRGAIFRSDARV